MTTFSKNLAKLKSDIKKLAAQQPELRNQRKSVYIVGDRKMSASDAREKHQENRELLRDMYIVYGMARGKKYEEIEVNPRENFYSPNWGRIERLRKEYNLDQVQTEEV